MIKKREKMTKGAKISLISLIVFALVGVSAFIIGYGLQDGFDAVLRWFGSRWAVYVYIALALGAFVVAWVIHESRMRK